MWAVCNSIIRERVSIARSMRGEEEYTPYDRNQRMGEKKDKSCCICTSTLFLTLLGDLVGLGPAGGVSE